MKASDFKNLRRKLIESYMKELRLSYISNGLGVMYDTPTNNPVLRSKMRDIEYVSASADTKLSRKLK